MNENSELFSSDIPAHGLLQTGLLSFGDEEGVHAVFVYWVPFCSDDVGKIAFVEVRLQFRCD